jgi:hypothetical protein
VEKNKREVEKMKGEKYLDDYKEVKGDREQFKKLLVTKYKMTLKAISNNYNLLKKQVVFTPEELITLPYNKPMLIKHESIACRSPGMLKMIRFKDMIGFKKRITIADLIRFGFEIQEINYLENSYGKFPLGD